MKYTSDEPVQHMSTSGIPFRFIILRSAQYSSRSMNSQHEARICIPPVPLLDPGALLPHGRISNTRYTHYTSANYTRTVWDILLLPQIPLIRPILPSNFLRYMFPIHSPIFSRWVKRDVSPSVVYQCIFNQSWRSTQRIPSQQ